MPIKRSIGLLSLLLGICCAAGGAEILEKEGVRVEVGGWNDIVASDGGGKRTVTFEGFLVKGIPNGRTRSGQVRKVPGPDQTERIEVDYGTGEDSPVKVTGRFTPRPWCVDVEFEVTGLPAGTDPGGSMFLRKLGGKADLRESLKAASWKRHEHGGVPFEVPEGLSVVYGGDDGEVVFAFRRENKVNPAWKDGFSQHAGLAYATAAEILDEAKFDRWLRFADPDFKGLLFDTPRGPTAILWSRKDGYTLSRKVPDFASPEPWQDLWETKSEIKVPTSAGEIAVIDLMGSERVIRPENGILSLELDGAPLIIRGPGAGDLEAAR